MNTEDEYPRAIDATEVRSADKMIARWAAGGERLCGLFDASGCGGLIQQVQGGYPPFPSSYYLVREDAGIRERINVEPALATEFFRLASMAGLNEFQSPWADFVVTKGISLDEMGHFEEWLDNERGHSLPDVPYYGLSREDVEAAYKRWRDPAGVGMK